MIVEIKICAHNFFTEYKRCLVSTKRCFIPECTSAYKTIPEDVRRKWLKHKKIFICVNTKCCTGHLNDANIFNIFEKTSFFTPKQLSDLIRLRDSIIDNKFENVWYSSCKEWTGLNNTEILSILNELPSLVSKRKQEILLPYLIKPRTGETDTRIGEVLGLDRTSIAKYCIIARNAMSTDFVPNHLGFEHLNRQQLLDRYTHTSKLLFGDNAVLIWDGTYLYTQKSGNYDFQRKSYSMQKHRCLVKPMMVVTPDEYVVEVYGSFEATKNDATIMDEILDSPHSPVQYLQDNDTFLLDRGFRDSLPKIRRNKLKPFMPSFIPPGESQLSWKDANESRKVTRCRYAVEKVNGYMKTRFRIFEKTIYNTTLSHLDKDFRNAVAIYNKFYYKGYDIRKTDEDDRLARILLNRLNYPNHLAAFVKRFLRYDNNRHITNIFHPTNRENILFPTLCHNDLKSISLGEYQIEQGKRYIFDHIIIEDNTR